MPAQTKILAKNFPFLRLVLAITAGIIIQWYFGIGLKEIIIFACTALILILAFYALPASKKFVLGWLRGILILLLFICGGMMATWQQNIHNNGKWYGRSYDPADGVIITIMEPLVEKRFASGSRGFPPITNSRRFRSPSPSKSALAPLMFSLFNSASLN